MEAKDRPGNRPHKLNDVQISLLRLFNREMSEQEISEVRQLLTTHYDEKLQAELEYVITERSYTQTDYDRLLNNQDRTGTNQQIKRSFGESSH